MTSFGQLTWSSALSPPNTTAANDGGSHSSIPSPAPLPLLRAASVCSPLPSPSVSPGCLDSAVPRMSLPPPRASSASSLCWLLCRLCSAPFRSSASATTPSWKTVPLSVFDFLLLQCSVDLIIHALTQSLNLRLTLPSLLLAAVHTQGLTSVSSSSSRASLFRLSLPSSSQVSASDSCSFRLPLLMLLESGLLSASSYSGSLLPPSALPCSGWLSASAPLGFL
ncbi:uncharacterized protein DS421_12g379720 [Arachis hypogaea]|nr:uncharacterized protein DS421_12g379720 [Arachis hypogaea]